MFEDTIIDHVLCSPRVSQDMILEVNRFGFVMRSASINYDQRQEIQDPSNILTSKDRSKQTSAVLTYKEHDYTNDISSLDANRVSQSCESRLYELHGIEQS
jgi:hypothetical protein